MHSSKDCPDISAWRELLDGSIPDDRQDGMAHHLESCAECRSTLEGLSGGFTLPLGADGHSPGEPPTPDAALQALLRRLKEERVEATAATDRPASSGMSLGFLPRSKDPSHLGRLGTYEITGVIGQGGMGVVLKGLDVRLNRVVAIKVLAQHLAADPMARQRFLGEAQKMAAVTHDHVVTIHAVDEFGEMPYIVMEYILGVSLEDRIRRTGTLKTLEILRIGMQAASGLAAAHAQGLIHRDIKPGNILLENGVERVKITDFGLAQAFDDAQATGSGLIAGTPQYMSPEQARGETLDHRSDLFSLGCVLYAMCTGRSPFRAETGREAMRRVREDTPRPIRSVNPEVPESVMGIIDRLLAKDPGDRLQSAGELAALLESHLAHLQQPGLVQAPAELPKPRPAPEAAKKRADAMYYGFLVGVWVLMLGVFALTETTGLTRVVATIMGRNGPVTEAVVENGPGGPTDVPPGDAKLNLQIGSGKVKVVIRGNGQERTPTYSQEVPMASGTYQVEVWRTDVDDKGPARRGPLTLTSNRCLWMAVEGTYSDTTPFQDQPLALQTNLAAVGGGIWSVAFSPKENLLVPQLTVDGT